MITLTLVHNPTQTLAQGIGERIRSLRAQNDLTVEQVADAARWFGLRWTGNTVTALEIGRRDIKVNELLMLPWVFLQAGVRGDEEVVLSDLLPTEPVTMTPDGTVAMPDGLRQVLHGETMQLSPSTWHVPRLAKEVKAATGALLVAAREVSAQLPPRAPGAAALDAMRDSAEEAVQKAARRLGYTPVQVQYAARSMWGRTLTEEREVRTSERTGPHTPRRSVQAVRARVTRDLLVELEPVLARYPKGE